MMMREGLGGWQRQPPTTLEQCVVTAHPQLNRFRFVQIMRGNFLYTSRKTLLI